MASSNSSSECIRGRATELVNHDCLTLARQFLSSDPTRHAEVHRSEPRRAAHAFDRLAGLPDQPDRALPEISVELPACLCHRRTPLRRCLHAESKISPIRTLV